MDKKQIAILTGNKLGTSSSILGNYLTKDLNGKKIICIL